MSTLQPAQSTAFVSWNRLWSEVWGVVRSFFCVVGKSAHYSGNWERVIRTSKQIYTTTHSVYVCGGEGGLVGWVFETDHMHSVVRTYSQNVYTAIGSERSHKVDVRAQTSNQNSLAKFSSARNQKPLSHETVVKVMPHFTAAFKKLDCRAFCRQKEFISVNW